jgi:hypothetical protein
MSELVKYRFEEVTNNAEQRDEEMSHVFMDRRA